MRLAAYVPFRSRPVLAQTDSIRKAKGSAMRWYSLSFSLSLSLVRTRVSECIQGCIPMRLHRSRVDRFDARNAIARCILRELIAPELCYSVKLPYSSPPSRSTPSPTPMDRCNTSQLRWIVDARARPVNIASRQLCPREN